MAGYVLPVERPTVECEPTRGLTYCTGSSIAYTPTERSVAMTDTNAAENTKEGRDYYLRQIRRIETRLLSLEKAKDDHPETIQLKETLIKIKDRLGE